MKNLTFHTLTQMNDDHATNSHYLTYTFPFKRLGGCTFWTWELKLLGATETVLTHVRRTYTSRLISLRSYGYDSHFTFLQSAAGDLNFSAQYARNQVFIGAHDRRTDVLEVSVYRVSETTYTLVVRSVKRELKQTRTRWLSGTSNNDDNE